MIKIDSIGRNTGIVEMNGNKNLILNELRQMIRYTIMVLGDVALEAINDGVDDAIQDLKEAKHDKDNRN